MASEVFANRAELRRRLLARMGATTDTSVYSQVTEQLNEFLRGAAQQVRDACEWKRTLLAFPFTTGIDQQYYNYPTNVGPGDVVRISLWDPSSETYQTLQRRVILPIIDHDPTLTGTDEINMRGKPQIWEDASQNVSGTITPAIRLNPYPDAAYTMKLEAYAAAQLLDDTTPSTVDADAIVLLAYAEVLDNDGREKQADVMRARAQQRIAMLSGAQRTGQIIRRGRMETARLKNGIRYKPPLNFDTSLSQFPPG